MHIDPLTNNIYIGDVGQNAWEEVDVARLVDAHLAQHLAHDDLDVLVVDRHALAAVDLLDFLDQVALDGVLATRVEIFLRVDRSVRDRVTGPDLLAVLDEDLGVVGDRVLALDDVLGAHDEEINTLALDDPDWLVHGTEAPAYGPALTPESTALPLTSVVAVRALLGGARLPLDRKVSAVIGTHTHVQTADEQIFPGGTAFLCDAGMCGPVNSILGRAIDPIMNRVSGRTGAPLATSANPRTTTPSVSSLPLGDFHPTKSSPMRASGASMVCRSASSPLTSAR